MFPLPPPIHPAGFRQAGIQRDGSRAESAGFGGRTLPVLHLPDCSYVDIFLDVYSLDGEDAEAFQARREALEAAVRQVHADRAEVVLTEKRRGERPAR